MFFFTCMPFRLQMSRTSRPLAALSQPSSFSMICCLSYTHSAFFRPYQNPSPWCLVITMPLVSRIVQRPTWSLAKSQHFVFWPLSGGLEVPFVAKAVVRLLLHSSGYKSQHLSSRHDAKLNWQLQVLFWINPHPHAIATTY